MNHQGKSRRERIEYARSRSILDVARDLGMELFRSGKDYRWKEHDSLVINQQISVILTRTYGIGFQGKVKEGMLLPLSRV